YVGLDPMEYSSGDKQRFGSISKGGSRLLRYLLVEAAQTAVSLHRTEISFGTLPKVSLPRLERPSRRCLLRFITSLPVNAGRRGRPPSGPACLHTPWSKAGAW